MKLNLTEEVEMKLYRLWDKLPEAGSSVDVIESLRLEEEIKTLEKQVKEKCFLLNSKQRNIEDMILKNWDISEIAEAYSDSLGYDKERLILAARKGQETIEYNGATGNYHVLVPPLMIKAAEKEKK